MTPITSTETLSKVLQRYRKDLVLKLPDDFPKDICMPIFNGIRKVSEKF